MDLSLPKRVQCRKNFGQLHVLRIFSSSLSTVPPLKISDTTLEKISSQARTASPMFFFSCRFLLRLVVLITDHTKPLESLNRGDRVVVPWYLVHTLVKPVPKAVEPLANLVKPVPNHVYLLHNYQNLREVYPGRRQVKTLKLVVADAKSSFFKVDLFNENVLQVR